MLILACLGVLRAVTESSKYDVDYKLLSELRAELGEFVVQDESKIHVLALPKSGDVYRWHVWIPSRSPKAAPSKYHCWRSKADKNDAPVGRVRDGINGWRYSAWGGKYMIYARLRATPDGQTKIQVDAYGEMREMTLEVPIEDLRIRAFEENGINIYDGDSSLFLLRAIERGPYDPLDPPEAVFMGFEAP